MPRSGMGRRFARAVESETYDRREFLRFMAAGGAALTATTLLPKRAQADGPRIAIVGAGLAGMTAAHRIFVERGWTSQVFEASDHVGGRTHTIRGLAGGQYTEAGGGGISSNERAIHNLCRRVGLWPLVDTWRGYTDGSETYFFGGQSYKWSELQRGVSAIEAAAYRAWKAIGSTTPTYKRNNVAARQFDQMSVNDFLADHTPYGPSTPAGSYVSHNHAIEYGATSDIASSIELILETSDIWAGGGYDERWAVPGGNDRLASKLASLLPGGSVAFGRTLVALRKNGDGTFTLTFDTGPDADADHVVIAIPVGPLRTVDLSAAGIPPQQLAAIDAARMGSNVKLNIQYAGQPWSASGHSGDASTDTIVESSWQASYQSKNPSILVMMNNEPYTGAPAHGPLDGTDLTATLGAIDAIYPGSSASAIAGQAYRDVWANDPLVGGSYAYAPLGWFTNFEGLQSKRAGNVHFAGEHTTKYTRQGTMDGAVLSGIRVANEVASRY